MLKEGLDVYVPLVDDFGIDAVIRKANNQFIEVQIKARSVDAKMGNAALFAAIVHPEVRKNYYFVFYSERLEMMWILGRFGGVHCGSHTKQIWRKRRETFDLVQREKN